jgi:hypothetical protein
MSIHFGCATREYEAGSQFWVGDEYERDRRCAPLAERLGDALEGREPLLRKRTQHVIEAAGFEVHAGRE